VEYECNPEIGSNDDIIELKKYLNNLGLKLMLDFVGNHAAVDSQ
jgi:maltooligosyltrehalose synthase